MESRAVVLQSPGPLPKPILRPVPKPRPGEVLLKVKASSVNYHDYVASTLGGLPALTWPRVPFSDVSAEVVGLGDNVHTVAVGDRVIPNFFPHWLDGAITRDAMAIVHGDQIDGGLQTYMCTSAGCLVPTPSHLSDLEAGTLGCAGVTAWRALIIDGNLRPGGTVVIQGTGGVSLFALGFAKMVGATVILTSSSDEKLARGRSLGADHLINYKREPAWDEAVMRITNGRGADVIADVGGATTLTQSINATAIGGHVSVIGVLSGFETPNFQFAQIMMRNITVQGITVGSVKMLSDMCAAISAHGYRPVLSHNFPLAEAEGALQAMLAQTHFGKITISVSDN